MSASSMSTASYIAQVNVSPTGITITFSGVDADLASLINAGKDFTVSAVEPRSFDSSDVTLKTKQVLQFVDPVVVPETPEV